MGNPRICLILTGLLFGLGNAGAKDKPIAAETCGRQAAEGDVYTIDSVDANMETLTLRSANGLSTVSVRGDAEITVNGVEKTIKDIQPGMQTKVTLAEPGVAVGIEATGDVATDAAGNPVNLKQALVGSRWAWGDGDRAVTFESDSASNGVWTADWKIIGPREVTLTIRAPNPRAGATAVFDFDSELKSFTGRSFAGAPLGTPHVRK